MAEVPAAAPSGRSQPGQPTSVDPVVERQGQAIAAGTMSPFCPGRTLADCPSPKAGQWRDDIRRWLASGVSPDEVKRRLRARIPDADLSGAPRQGFGWVWMLLLPAGFALLFVIVRRMAAREAATGPGGSSGMDTESSLGQGAGGLEKGRELERRLDQELEDQRLEDD